MTGPLHGVRIIMMGGLGPAPFCRMLLGDLGSEAIRIDALAGVDGPLPIDYTVRRSQRSLAADVKDPRGRDLVHRLTTDADAFVDVYRPGVAERLGPQQLRLT
jgi:alpha-methylacyl-CoA racemase